LGKRRIVEIEQRPISPAAAPFADGYRKARQRRRSTTAAATEPIMVIGFSDRPSAINSTNSKGSGQFFGTWSALASSAFAAATSPRPPRSRVPSNQLGQCPRRELVGGGRMGQNSDAHRAIRRMSIYMCRR
jgi:hypothetical protein